MGRKRIQHVRFVPDADCLKFTFLFATQCFERKAFEVIAPRNEIMFDLPWRIDHPRRKVPSEIVISRPMLIYFLRLPLSHPFLASQKADTPLSWFPLRSTNVGPTHFPVPQSDGSYDLYFGPNVLTGKKKNFVKTVSGKGWFFLFRLYGPEEAYFDGKWKPEDIVKVN